MSRPCITLSTSFAQEGLMAAIIKKIKKGHAYYYAGYDTEADCTPGDYRLPPPTPVL